MISSETTSDTIAVIKSYVIKVVATSQKEDRAIIRFETHRHGIVIQEPVPLASVLDPIDNGQSEDQTCLFVLVFVSGGQQIDKQLEDWIRKDPIKAQPFFNDSSSLLVDADSLLVGESPAEFVMRSDRVIFRHGKALVIGNEDRLAETIAGLAYYSFYQSELLRLESEVASAWEIGRRDMQLMHKVNNASLRRWSEVVRQTEWITAARIDFARLEPKLDCPPQCLPATAQRIVGELTNHFAVRDRLEALEARIEVFENMYELCNDRLSEYSFFSREYRLEIWILVVLVIEVVVMLIELWMLAK